jgi:hypothetical protein
MIRQRVKHILMLFILGVKLITFIQKIEKRDSKN